MQAFKGQQFEGRSFDLDETVFFNCKLKDCDLFYAGGDFEWIETSFENCRFHWRGLAKNMLALLQTIGLLKPQGAPAIPQTGGVKPN